MTPECIYVTLILLMTFGFFMGILEITKLLREILVELRRNRENYEVESPESGDYHTEGLKMVWSKAKSPTDRAEQWIMMRERESRG